MKKLGLIVDANWSFCAGVFALLALRRTERNFLLNLIGTSDINSTPPATMTS